MRLGSHDNPQIRQIKVFGERNSGTNYLVSLLRKNLLDDSCAVLEKEYGWKHRFVNAQELAEQDTTGTLFINLTKDPYAWIVSMHGKPHHAPQLYGLPFDEFVRSPWSSWHGEGNYKRDLDKSPLLPEQEMVHDRSTNVVDLRNRKNRAALQLPEGCENYCFMRYEQLLDDAEAAMQQLGAAFGLPLAAELVRSDGYHGKNQNVTFTRNEHYAERRYLDNYSPALLGFVNEHLDHDVEAQLGYARVDELPRREPAG